ncbi:MAG TPA: methylated-DNA--[protein]-cysteine S-methyltransferase [Casimicrobiaceae bacterium]|jgi:methylated-DNA-[protein]-cysteine S-methyltransferase
MTPVIAHRGTEATTAVHVTRVSTWLGMLHVASFAEGVCALVFDARAQSLEPRLRRAFGPFFRIEAGDPLRVAPRLARYFGGDLRALDDVPLAAPSTPMQWRVWRMVRAIAPGESTTYAALAERLGMPRAQRAVGVCLASNPVPLLVPCHRVVAASGSLGSHPGGVPVKAALLRHEGVRLAAPRRTRTHAPLDDTVELVAMPLG